MKNYNINTLSVENVRELIRNGDDNHNNQIRVTKTGEIFLSQDVVGAIDIDNLAFRFESFDAHNGYVGLKASQDDEYVHRIYNALKKYWKNQTETYVDNWNY